MSLGLRKVNCMNEADWVGFGTNWRALTMSKEVAAQSQSIFITQGCGLCADNSLSIFREMGNLNF